ncbi:DUF2065 domain-containing protein [Novilysobacter spongiicola]|uniref:DUF2065 domain-containing protein n=1 Tax=Lysobacter spongiicola DSM 21749 TaxID=1122188 RepID=A0A1T4S9Z8_9GAMM|nr:DUF2065 family protein [Lysobacter spongiicola]SKA25022.1 hypothetical protein SAMN02745674_02671 [Lysobacter spongiicola DSM 21749]
MVTELLSALCLAAVLEGLFLFVAPGSWRRAIDQARALGDRELRVLGGVILGAGLLALWLTRQFL